MKKKIAIFSSKNELKYYQHLFQTQGTNSSDDPDISDAKNILHIFSECVLKSYSSPFLLRVGSPFEEPINRILVILFESGLLTYWQQTYNEHRLRPGGVRIASNFGQSNRFKTAEFSNFSLNQLYAALVILITCELVAVWVFICEILYYHMNGVHDVASESGVHHIMHPPPTGFHFIH